MIVAPTGPDLTGLFSPIEIGPLTLANRFVMPGMQRGFSRDGNPSAELAGYYARRVAGGTSLIIGESSAVDHPSATAQSMACRLTPATVDGWAGCVDAVHAAGGHMILQLWHEGGLRRDDDGRTLSPSGLGHPGLARGHAATIAELEAVREAFVASARLARRAGADGVEVHAAHGYLLDQFLWEATNRRTDGYGGAEIADRARLPTEIVAAIRDACGPDFLISVRLSQWKEHDYAARIAPTPGDLKHLVTLLREAGADLLHASTRRFWTPEWPGSDLSVAGWTRALGGLPTITVGSVGLDRDVMESFTEEGEATSTLASSLGELARRFNRGDFDLVSVGRSLISDPDWVRKVRDGAYDDVRPFRKSDIATLAWES